MQINDLEQKIEELIQVYTDLEARYTSLLADQQAWQLERNRLLETNRLARTRVKEMIIRLKALEQG